MASTVTSMVLMALLTVVHGRNLNLWTGLDGRERGVDFDIDVSDDPENPGYTTSFKVQGTLFSYDNEKARYLVLEPESDGGNIGLVTGDASALSIGLGAEADAEVDYVRDPVNDRNTIVATALTNADNPIFSNAQTSVQAVELAFGEAPNDGPVGLAFNQASASGESTQEGANAGALSFLTTQTNAEPGSAFADRLAGSLTTPEDAPEGTTSNEAQGSGFAIAASNRADFDELLRQALADQQNN